MLKLTTDALDAFGFFDPRYTAEMDNSSPELKWSDPPADCKGYALTFEDLINSQNEFTLWVVYAIPESISHLPAGIPPQEILPNGIRQGLNGFGKLGYAGPNPAPKDPPHAYRFRLFALNQACKIPSRATGKTVLGLIRPHTSEIAELKGRYQRQLQRAG